MRNSRSSSALAPGLRRSWRTRIAIAASAIALSAGAMTWAASTPAHAAVATAHPSRSAAPACGTITAETARFGSTPAGVQLMYNQCTRNVWAFANTNLFGSNTACASSGIRCETAVEAINSSGHPFSSVCGTPSGSHYCTTSQIGDANTTSYAVGVYEDYQGNVWYAQTGNF